MSKDKEVWKLREDLENVLAFDIRDSEVDTWGTAIELNKLGYRNEKIIAQEILSLLSKETYPVKKSYGNEPVVYLETIKCIFKDKYGVEIDK